MGEKRAQASPIHLGEEKYMSEIGEREHVTCQAVVRAVAAVSNRPIMELPPLADSINPDSLDQLFASPPTPHSLQFSYAGCRVRVEPGQVRIHPR